MFVININQRPHRLTFLGKIYTQCTQPEDVAGVHHPSPIDPIEDVLYYRERKALRVEYTGYFPYSTIDSQSVHYAVNSIYSAKDLR